MNTQDAADTAAERNPHLKQTPNRLCNRTIDLKCCSDDSQIKCGTCVANSQNDELRHMWVTQELFFFSPPNCLLIAIVVAEEKVNKKG